MLNHMPDCRINLSGSTPPFCGAPNFFQNIEMTVDPLVVRERRRQLAAAMAARQSAHPDEMHFSVGSSLVFTQVLAALTEPGDTVLIETPTYDPFVESARFLKLKVEFFRRSEDFEADFRALKKWRLKSKVMVVSNPNCPTGQIYNRENLIRLAGAVKTLIVDEVFLPLFSAGRMSLLDGERPSNIVTIGSFSKSLGLSVLRLGWLRAPIEVGQKYEAIGLNLHIEGPAHSILAGLKAVENWDGLVAPNLKRADENRGILQSWAQKNPNRLSHDFSRGYFGTLTVPERFRSGDEFANEFLRETGVWLRPTTLFYQPKAVRFHMLLEPDQWGAVAKQLLEFARN